MCGHKIDLDIPAAWINTTRVGPRLGMEGASETIDPTGGTGAALPRRIAHDRPGFDSLKQPRANHILV
jgi:hypothetical protein